MRIGVLTSGGDCPGLNAVIRSVVHRAVADHGDEVIGFRDGWKGLLECDYLKLDLDAVGGILARGGTILGSSRVQPSHLRDGVERARGHVEELGLDAVMGRHTGWIALHSGMAAGAHAIVVPERPFDIEELARRVGERFEAGKRFAIVVAAEGAKPAPGSMAFDEGAKDIYGHERFAGIARQLSIELEQRLGKEARPVIL